MNTPDSNSWLALRSGPSDAAANMALDAALLETAPSLGAPLLRFYGWTEPAASFGYFQKIAEVENMTHLRPLVRRPTGGGVVPHDNDWTYSFAVPPNDAWYALKAEESYRRVHEWLQAAFLKLGVATELAPDSRRALPGQCFAGHEKSDVLRLGRKIAGAAQRRTRTGLLIQGSVQPPANLSRDDWENALCNVAQTNFGVAWTEFTVTPAIKDRMAELAAKIYSQAAHNRRR